MFLRIRYCRAKHKNRSIISLILFLVLFSFSLISIVGNIREHKIEIQRQEAYDKAPTPTIQILSQSWNLWNETWYTLVFIVSWATDVFVDNQKLILTWGSYKQNISLEGIKNISKTIAIVAKNEYKTTNIWLNVYRNKTQEEITAEKAEELRIANEQAKGEIITLDGYIKEMNEWYSFYDVATISATANRLETLWTLIATDLDSKSPILVQKAKEAKAKLISVQKSVFPSLRQKRCGVTKDTMREYNVDVKCYWWTIKFIWGIFASNSNIKDSYLAISDMLYLLRFKKASFYWYEGSDYQYYTLDTPSDWAFND